jgi:replicative DNA helicase
MAATEIKILPATSQAEAINQAKGHIQSERSGTIRGLYTRWPGINNFMMKYWRFKTVTGMGGMSGCGKSAILNMIEDDFTNPELNPTFLRHKDEHGNWVGEDRIMVLAFKYEMDASDEVLRNLSGKVQKSYSYLLSSHRNKEDGKYNTVSDEEFDDYCEKLEKLKDRPIIYFETAGNLEQMYATCHYYKQKYPNREFIVTIDHTLLSKKLSERDDGELMAATGQTAIRLRKSLGMMVIFLCQLNGEIEKPQRRLDNRLHFPVKTDIHWGSQVYWACDNIIIWHRPENLGIEKYGHFRVDKDMISVIALGLIHACCIKSRKNNVGNIWFREAFAVGNMFQVKVADIKAKNNMGVVT